MSIIQGVVDYVTACPLLKDGLMRVDCMGTQPVEYAIAVMPTSPIVERYVDGSTVRQYMFSINSREYYTLDMIQNIANSEFYEDLADWFEEQDLAGNYPDIGEDKDVQAMKLLSPGYLYSTDKKTAQYQMQLRIEYYQEA